MTLEKMEDNMPPLQSKIVPRFMSSLLSGKLNDKINAFRKTSQGGKVLLDQGFLG